MAYGRSIAHASQIVLLLMSQPLASFGKGLHSVGVRRFPVILLFATLLFGPGLAMAQIEPRIDDGLPTLPPPDILPDIDPDQDTDDENDTPGAPPVAPAPEIDQPDYSRLSSSQERAVRLSGLFDRLSDADSESDADLIAEEIYAIWLDSGSASVNLVLRRGVASHRRQDLDQARGLFNHVTRLQPDFAEGWARSARLALEEEDYERALVETVQTLSLEPRHFYALWTLGNVFERLGRLDEALEAYSEAARLHPQLTSVVKRVETLEQRLGGSVL